MTTLDEKIKSWAEHEGFQQIGYTDVDLSEHAPRVHAWLARGFAGEMGYLKRNLEKRLDPALLEVGTCTVISARMNYLAPVASENAEATLADPQKAYISRYALGRDYHKVLRRRLARLGQRINDEIGQVNTHFRAFVDSAPVLEKALGHKAGLGWIGKNTLLLNREVGSWFFVGEIYTNIPLANLSAAVGSNDAALVKDECGACKACITVCPTKALVGPRDLDARRCISYLTIENKGPIDPELRPLMGNRVFGCDDCQLFCPWNRATVVSSETDFTPRHNLDNSSLLSLFQWSQAQFLARTEGSAIRRINFDQWQRNLAVGLGNGPADPAVIDALRARRAQASALVREHIDWALERLGGSR
ncbi:MAG: tRNA epoxyqueuosine(34) reductase QueG [Proteobacteria bacterium]|nr:tRNA epoxyqueuosine(34) reductase QueG [Pseudomonadota bacterium]